MQGFFNAPPAPDANAGIRGLVNTIAQSFAGAKRGLPNLVTMSSGTYAVNLGVANNWELLLNNQATLTLAAPTEYGLGGQSGCILLRQGGTTPTVITFASNWKFPGGVVPTLTPAVNAVDLLVYYTGHYYTPFVTAQLLKDFK